MKDKQIQFISFTDNLEQVAKIRYALANYLENIAAIIQEAEIKGQSASGALSLATEIEQLNRTGENLRNGIFKLLVLGDLKRGKSTFLNALIGENLLPSDVNPCTALLTVLRYGKEKQVTVYFKNGESEKLDLATFKQRYTIDPNEAKILASQDKLAFPDVDRAIVEYPLDLLKQGIEIIDSPGLNDTEARNHLALSYIYNVQAILFVFRALQPCTLNERRYLENYLKGRGLNIFFLINAWDEIKQSLIDSEDEVELQAAETKLRQVFKANLTTYTQIEETNFYQQRVFEISSLMALRKRLKDEDDLVGTGFPEFTTALNNFLTQERAVTEFQRAFNISQQADSHVREAIARRIPLLDHNLEELKQKIDSVRPEFEQLRSIRDNFQAEIIQTKERQAREIADSFKEYILKLEETFETDFLESQADLDFLEFLDKNKRAAFYTSFKRAFERYMNDRLAGWEFTAKQKLTNSFTQLNQKGKEYQVSYGEVVEAINEKLLGSRFYAEHNYQAKAVSPWADRVSDIFDAIPDNLNSAVTSFNMFWQTVLIYACVAIALNVVGLLFTTLALNIFGALLLGMGAVALQAEYVRQQFITTTKKEFVKYLPQIASEQWQPIYQAIERCFNIYQEQAISRIDNDINSRQQELSNLLQQKESRVCDRDAEVQRLQQLATDIKSELQKIASLFS